MTRRDDEPWRDEAACAGRATRKCDPWFPPANNDPRPYVEDVEAAPAIAICSTCPVRTECLTAAMSVEAGQSKQRFGIFGGLTARQRVLLASASRLSKENRA